MCVKPLLLLVPLLGFLANCQGTPEDTEADDSKEIDDSKEVLVKGFASLMDKQGDDGGWHSDTYGAMRGGAGSPTSD